MPDVIFVKTRTMLLPNTYDAYDDFFNLAELSGYQTIFINELDPASDNTYIITPRNGEWNHGWNNPRARIVHWDLEWRLQGQGYQWEKAEYDDIPGVAETWASDKWYAGIIGARYVPLGSHPGLVLSEKSDDARYDVAILSCLSEDGGRQHIFSNLMEAGLSIAPNAWNPHRDAILKASHVMLHTHQWRNVHTVAPLRYAIAAAYALPLVSEYVEDASIFQDAVLFCRAESMPDYLNTMIKRHYSLMLEYGKELYELLCVEHSFRKCVEAAL